MRHKIVEQTILGLVILLVVTCASCKKDDETAPNLSGTYESNCVRKDPNTGNSSYYPNLTWEVIKEGSKYRVNNLHPSGTGYAPRPFQWTYFTPTANGTLDINEVGYKGTGSYSTNGMFWSFTETAPGFPDYRYDWDCTCVK